MASDRVEKQKVRMGAHLWRIWDGVGYEPERTDAEILYTEGHVSLDDENELVKDSLALALQREGLADGLGRAYRSIEQAGQFVWGYAGLVGPDLTMCEDSNGISFYGEAATNVEPITWIEVVIDAR
jgi:hypothetical protein